MSQNEPLDLGATKEEIRVAVARGLCVDPPIGCGQIAVAFKDELSAKEYRITGMCQVCQDKLEDYLTRLENESDEQDHDDWVAEREALGYETNIDRTGYLPDEEEPPF